MSNRLVAASVAGAVLTACLILLSDADWPTSECKLAEWVWSRSWTQAPDEAALSNPANPLASHQLAVASHDALRNVGLRNGVSFARFDKVTLDAVLELPHHHTGALLLIVPGTQPPTRRGTQPFVSALPGAANLTAVLPLNALNVAAYAVEAARGRQLGSFTLDTRPLRSCISGDGPCAVWEVSSGRVVLDSALASKLGGMQELRPLLAQFTGEMLSQVQAGAAKLGAGGEAVLRTLANLFAAAGPGALTLLLAGPGALPVWFCIACPAMLGLLAPFLFNFGLTAAAEQICQHFQLPDEECADLWWGAFALALVISLASAIPIVYVCRLPECIQHLVRPY